MKVAGIAFSLVLNFALFFLSFRLLTVGSRSRPGSCCRRDRWPLSCGRSCSWSAATTSTTSTGTPATPTALFALVIALLVWLHLGAQITVYAAEVNVVVTRAAVAAQPARSARRRRRPGDAARAGAGRGALARASSVDVALPLTRRRAGSGALRTAGPETRPGGSSPAATSTARPRPGSHAQIARCGSSADRELPAPARRRPARPARRRARPDVRPGRTGHRLVGALQEQVRDLDPGRARTQRGERVDQPLRPVGARPPARAGRRPPAGRSCSRPPARARRARGRARPSRRRSAPRRRARRAETRTAPPAATLSRAAQPRAQLGSTAKRSTSARDLLGVGVADRSGSPARARPPSISRARRPHRPAEVEPLEQLVHQHAAVGRSQSCGRPLGSTRRALGHRPAVARAPARRRSDTPQRLYSPSDE